MRGIWDYAETIPTSDKSEQNACSYRKPVPCEKRSPSLKERETAMGLNWSDLKPISQYLLQGLR